MRAFAEQVGAAVRRFEGKLQDTSPAQLHQLLAAGKWALAVAAGILPTRRKKKRQLRNGGGTSSPPPPPLAHADRSATTESMDDVDLPSHAEPHTDDTSARQQPYVPQHRLGTIEAQLAAHGCAAQLLQSGYPSASQALSDLKPFVTESTFEELSTLDRRGSIAKHRGFQNPDYRVPVDVQRRPQRLSKRNVADAVSHIEERLAAIEAREDARRRDVNPVHKSEVATQKEQFLSILDTCIEAKDLGYLLALGNPAGRTEAEGHGHHELLSALKRSSGLVNAAKLLLEKRSTAGDPS